MTIEQAKSELEQLEPQEKSLWLKLEKMDNSARTIRDEWSAIFTRADTLRTFLKVNEEETPTKHECTNHSVPNQ